MNIYLCSTVRHLLFSLLKALAQPQQKQIIFMICDQQNIDENNFDKAALPAHIQVVFIKRRAIREQLYRGVKGKIIKLLANFNISLSATMQLKLATNLFAKTLNVPLSKNQLTSAQLFLFNDRNKISRLFRLLFKEYSLIEEGLGNYRGFPLKMVEKVANKLTFNSRKMRYFGDNKHCQNIYLLTPPNAPLYIRHKTKKIDFIHSALINKYCLKFFRCHLKQRYQTIIATQPLAATGIDLVVYKEVIKRLTENKISVALKPHPSEDISRYQKEFPNIELIDSKLPLELIFFGAEEKTKVISIYSSAGMGFEEYCNRCNLINNEELNHLPDLFLSWKKNPSLITKRVNERV